MNLTKPYIEEIFEEVKDDYSVILRDLPCITLTYIPKQKLVDDSKSTRLAHWIISLLGEEEYSNYPSFAAVYADHKDPEVYEYTGTYYVSFCFELAKQLLDPIEDEYKVRCYLRHVLAHEITHVVEEKIIESSPSLWNVILKDSSMAGEKLAEIVACSLDHNNEKYKEVHHLLFDGFINKLKEAGSK